MNNKDRAWLFGKGKRLHLRKPSNRPYSAIPISQTSQKQLKGAVTTRYNLVRARRGCAFFSSL